MNNRGLIVHLKMSKKCRVVSSVGGSDMEATDEDTCSISSSIGSSVVEPASKQLKADVVASVSDDGVSTSNANFSESLRCVRRCRSKIGYKVKGSWKVSKKTSATEELRHHESVCSNTDSFHVPRSIPRKNVITIKVKGTYIVSKVSTEVESLSVSDRVNLLQGSLLQC